jgi:hypothetical protein
MKAAVQQYGLRVFLPNRLRVGENRGDDNTHMQLARLLVFDSRPEFIPGVRLRAALTAEMNTEGRLLLPAAG